MTLAPVGVIGGGTRNICALVAKAGRHIPGLRSFWFVTRKSGAEGFLIRSEKWVPEDGFRLLPFRSFST